MSVTHGRFGLTIDQRGGPATSVQMRFMGRVRSDFPHGVSVRCAARIVPQQVLPEGIQIVASWQSVDAFEVLAEAKDCVIHVEVGNGGMFVRIAARSVEAAETLGQQMRGQLDPAKADEVNVVIWNSSNSGGSYSKRTLSALPWSDVA